MVCSIECAIAAGPTGALQPHLFLFSIGNSAAPACYPCQQPTSTLFYFLLLNTAEAALAPPKRVSNRRGLQNCARRAGGRDALAAEPLASFASGWRRDDFQVTGEIAQTRSRQTFERSNVWALKRSAVKRLSVEPSTVKRLSVDALSHQTSER